MRTLLFLLLSSTAVLAQSTDNPPPGGSIVAQCIYNTSVPPPTVGKPFYLQCDASGSLITSAGALFVALDQPTGTNQTVLLTGATETMNLPPQPKTGDVIKVIATADTNLTVAPGQGSTLAQPFSATVPARTGLEFIYVGGVTGGTWYRVQ
jgi:hypothetical protein